MLPPSKGLQTFGPATASQTVADVITNGRKPELSPLAQRKIKQQQAISSPVPHSRLWLCVLTTVICTTYKYSIYCSNYAPAAPVQLFS